MKLNQNLKADIEKYKNYVIIVEGNKDIDSLKSLGFEKVYAIHQNAVSIKERAEQIIQQTDKKDRFCIMTDFDKKGKELYFKLKTIFQELGARLDSTLRGIFLKARISHIEGAGKFIGKLYST
ncbi:MAG: toprim domain-containing protein [Nanoarchaeota archaeon]